MNVGYTVFHSKEYNDSDLDFRKDNVEEIHKSFGQFDYVENNVIMVKDLSSYKNAIKGNIDLRKVRLGGKIRFGTVGLTFTTFLAYKKMLDYDKDIFIIFEDDAMLNPNAVDISLQYLEELPKNFDIFSMYENPAFYKKYSQKYEIEKTNVCKSYNDRSTLAYAISKKGIEKYYFFMKDLVDLPIDLYLFDENKDTEKYAIKPTSKQPFFSNNFSLNGDPNYKNSSINKTREFDFK